MRSLLLLVVIFAFVAAQDPLGPPEVCSLYMGYHTNAPSPPTEAADVYQPEFLTQFSQYGAIPAPIGAIKDIVCDISHTMEWKAEDKYNMFWLSPNSARSHFDDLSHEWQIMETHCMFDENSGLYTQFIYNEEDHSFVSRQEWVFQQHVGSELTTVVALAFYPEYVIENANEYYHDYEFALWNNLSIELERLYTLATAGPICDEEPLDA